ncbi:MAG: substrate-binding domain-containing protein [Bacteroidaceae bacterium]|nr:substrate-binding domain-containing protein [Bacteroidaceae bacterium]
MKEKSEIGLVMKSLQADFFKIMGKGARDYVALHPEIELVTVGTQSQVEVKQQIELVDELIERNVDAIVLVPIDSDALVPPVVRAVRAGIKVVNIDIRLNPVMLARQKVQVAYIGPDNETAAYEAGQVLASYLQQGNEVIIIEGLKGAENAVQRKNGHMRAIREAGLTLVASESANWETDKASEVFSRLIALHPKVKGVFCGNDAMALGVVNVLDFLYRDEIKVCGFDNDPSAQRLIKEGKQVSTIDIFSSQIAVEGIKCAVDLLTKGENIAGEVTTKYLLYKKS